MSETDLNRHIERVFEAFDRQDAKQAAAQFAEDGVFVEATDDQTFSKTEFREYLAERIFVGFPDYTVIDTDVKTTYEWATVVEYTFRATHEGPLGERPPSGNRVTLPIVAVITVSNEGITAWRDYVDSERFREQLDDGELRDNSG